MRFCHGEQFVFREEPGSPYSIRAIGGRFAVLTRPATQADADAEGYEGDVSKEVAYSIIDNETWMRGPHNLILNPFDFKTDNGCEDCLQELESSRIELSKRKSIPIQLEFDDV